MMIGVVCRRGGGAPVAAVRFIRDEIPRAGLCLSSRSGIAVGVIADGIFVVAARAE